MRKTKILGTTFAILLALLLLVTTDEGVLEQPAPLPAGTYEVVKVVDGDTITILKDDKNQSVRLIGIDTPETVDPRRPVECFGQAATDEMRRLVADKAVRIETDPSQDEYDAYGRLLAYVYAGDIFVNQHLIAEGFAHEYTFIRPYAYQDAFRAAEQSAEDAQKGLWAPNTCT